MPARIEAIAPQGVTTGAGYAEEGMAHVNRYRKSSFASRVSLAEPRPSSVTHSHSSASAKLNATPTSPEDLSAIYAFLNTQRE